MKRIMIGILLVIALLAGTASAFTLETIDITVAENGDADVTAGYSLTWLEQVIVFMKIDQPERELEQALEQYTGKQVEVISVGRGFAILNVSAFASVTKKPDTILYSTSSMDFSVAENAIKKAWFARFVTIDTSPENTMVRFPDGYEKMFSEKYLIPSVQHEIMK